MKSIEITAKTLDEAIEQALSELNISKDQADIEIIEEPQKGLFGLIGNRMAKVKVSERELVDPVKIAKDFLFSICDKMGIKVEIESTVVDNYTHLSFTGDGLGILIGRRGETLDAMQYLTNLTVNKKIEDRVKFILDVEGYRKRREETLNKLARRLSDKAKQTRTKVVLEPMNPHERRIIHTALQDEDSVSTYSEGDEPFRKVVISPKNC